jgi:hypothetical protein
MAPVEAAWAVSITLRALLAIVCRYRLLRGYLIFSVAGSLIMWMAPAGAYSTLYLCKAAALCLLNLALVLETERHLGHRLSVAGWCVVALVSAGCHLWLAHPQRWPSSLLEPLSSLMALWSLALGLAMVAAIRRCRTGVWYGHACVLTAYLLLDSLNGHAAPLYLTRIGINIGISTSLCYLAWMWVWRKWCPECRESVFDPTCRACGPRVFPGPHKRR